MLIDQVLYPVEALGPGKRAAIWTVGCWRACPGCSNPELWEPSGQTPVTPEELFSAISRIAAENQVEGITITGGEPFDQAEELLRLTSLLRRLTGDILIFTGYRHEELLEMPKGAAVLENVAAIVDGSYRRELNRSLPLRGSENQRVLLFDRRFEKRYAEYLDTDEKRVQNFFFEDETVSVGIHGPDFKENLNNILREMDLKEVRNG